jgi:uncharacterized protein (TIGR02996 family)
VAIETELLDAIRAAPHDDAPRLVYADHLIAQDDPRGEFIASQVMRSIDTRPRWVELLRAHRDTWTAPARRIGATDVQFERGFIERISLDSVGAFLEHAGELATWAPVPAVRVTSSDSLATFAPDYKSAAISTRARAGVQLVVYDIATRAVRIDRVIACDARAVRYWFASPRRLIVALGEPSPSVDLAF